jgi:transcriptional regulator
MYAQPAFKVHPAVALAFTKARGFGLVVTCDAGRPVASHLPFRLIETDGKVPRLQFHVARPNPLAALAEKGGTWLVAVQGDDAYVSPDFYASADQVPTWLYEAVHLSGPVHVIAAEHAPEHLEALSAQFEQWLAPKPPWTMARLAGRRREMLLNAIVAIEMRVETIESSFKLNQHKPEQDYASVARALAEQSDHGSQTISARMKAVRPGLDYAVVRQPSPVLAGTEAGA